jgi:prenyltransferase beta subunit
MVWRRRQLLESMVGVGVLGIGPRVGADGESSRQATRNYLLSLRNQDGGFRVAAAEGPSQLLATVGITRGVRYWGGKLPEREKTAAWVSSCYHPSLGAFSDNPGTTPDVRSTALALMALSELKAPLDRYAHDTIRYLDANATSLSDIYFTVAALDITHLDSAAAGRFALAYEAMERPDGSFSRDAYDEAAAAITLLRLGKGPAHPEVVAQRLLATQRSDGGFRGQTPSQESELAGVYRIVRALYMLHAAPDKRSLRSFIARCRNADGGYGPMPGKPSSGPTTYYAGIVSHWLEKMVGW